LIFGSEGREQALPLLIACIRRSFLFNLIFSTSPFLLLLPIEPNYSDHQLSSSRRQFKDLSQIRLLRHLFSVIIIILQSTPVQVEFTDMMMTCGSLS
jgi:hypothetical protein